MKRLKNRPILLVVVFSLATLYAMMGMVWAAPVQAIGPMGSGIEILVFDTDHVSTPCGSSCQAQGLHDGSVTCERDDQAARGWSMWPWTTCPRPRAGLISNTGSGRW